MDEDEDMLTCMMSAHEDFQQQLGAILLAKDLRGLAKRVVMDGQAEILADRARGFERLDGGGDAVRRAPGCAR